MFWRMPIAALVLSASSWSAAQSTSARVAHLDLTQGIPIVQVRINGLGPFAFVVDTGTNCDAIVSPRLVKRLGLRSLGHANITDLGGHSTLSLDAVELKSLAVAGTQFNLLRAVVTDLPDGDSVLDGILGFGLFREKLLTLDYPRRRLVLEEGKLAPGDAHVLALEMPDGIPFADISIAGQSVKAGIDSGGLGLSIPAAMAQRVPLAGRTETAAYGRTQVSEFELSGAVLNSVVKLAGFTFENPWLEVNPVFKLANVGSVALRDFAVTFDQKNKLVRFSVPGKLHSLTKPPNHASGTRVDELVGTVVVTQAY